MSAQLHQENILSMCNLQNLTKAQAMEEGGYSMIEAFNNDINNANPILTRMMDRFLAEAHNNENNAIQIQR